jgi:large subunit ribosomal protein L23
MNSYDVVLRPLVTEKAIAQEGQNTYWFAVDINANKTQVRKAVEEIYQVHVRRVHTMRVGGKQRRSRFKMFRTPDWKKAGVTLAPGERIDIV